MSIGSQSERLAFADCGPFPNIKIQEDPIIFSIQNVSKTYAKSSVKAVDDLNLEVKDGEVFGFLGPNGAGKSTTIKMLTGILSPDRGDIVIDGVSMCRNPLKAKRKIGYVPDQHAVYEKLSGREYLNFICDVFRVPGPERKARMERYLELFELKDSVNQQIRSYSHGMKQKIAVIAALCHDPDLWVLDEPMTGLDPQSSYHLKELMKEHCKKGHTVFFSSHVLEVVEKICDRVAIIEKGKIIACGTLDELRAQGGSLEQVFLNLTAKDAE